MSGSPATSALSPTPVPADKMAASICPFHDGAETLDLLLAGLSPREIDLLDAVLDLRSLLVAGEDAAACLAQLFRVRALLDDRHYLAFYRVRRWISRRIFAKVRADRAAPWLRRPLPLGGARFDEITNSCLAAIATDGVLPVHAQICFVFASAAVSDPSPALASASSDV